MREDCGACVGADAMGNVSRAIAGGALATGVTTALASAARQLGWFRISFPQVLGTAVIAGPGAPAVGRALHVLNGVGFAALYRIPLRRIPARSRVAAGAALGALHALAALAGLALLPRWHPRPARAGLTRLSLTSYGPLTVPAMLGGHALYGAIIGRSLRGARAGRPHEVHEPC